jgi:dCTP deaminase
MVFEKEKNKIKVNVEKKPFLYDDHNNIIKNKCFDNKLILSLELTKNNCGYQAKDTNDVIDLNKKNHDWKDFFKEIKLSNKNGLKINLEKDKFYILSTKEKIMIPPNYSSEMIPFSHLIGELRVHYAGFFDPGFGYSKDNKLKGSKGTLEIRAHENIIIYDGQPICFMEFFKNKSIPNEIYNFKKNNYQGQKKAKLSKFFKKK